LFAFDLTIVKVHITAIFLIANVEFDAELLIFVIIANAVIYSGIIHHEQVAIFLNLIVVADIRCVVRFQVGCGRGLLLQLNGLIDFVGGSLN